MKRLIICCDGTWQRADQTWLGRDGATNVVRLARSVAKQDAAGTSQIAWYDAGVGSGNLLDAVLGGLTGFGLDENIMDAYRFLVANYVPGDELFLFGFSRGAYTVRSLAGLIRKCGIVLRDRLTDLRKVMALYRDGDHPDDKNPTEFRKLYSVAGDSFIAVKLIGVWDTVGALGVPVGPFSKLTRSKFLFHDTTLSKTVEYAYQALAVDERRNPFAPTLWTPTQKPGQTLEQAWFSGTHSDVGGGGGSEGLPDVSLAWMLEKAQGAGLALDAKVTAAFPPQPNPLAPMNIVERLPIWNLLTADRSIGLTTDGDPDPTQSLNPAVTTRWDRATSYRPSNLAAYFARTKNPRGASVPTPTLFGWRRA